MVVGARTGVVVSNQDGDGSAGRQAFEDTGKYLCPVGFVALRGEAALTRATAVQVGLQVVGGEGQARWAAVHHDADPGTVALAPCGEAEGVSEGVAHVGRA